MIKTGVRTIGIDDGPFERSGRGDVLVAGAIYCGGDTFDGLLTTRIRKDGWNSTSRILAMLRESKFLPQLHYIMIDGIALGGFNIVKVLAIARKKPDLGAIRRALRRVSLPEKRWDLLLRAGEIHRIGKLHCQLAGIDPEEASELLSLTCTRSHIPEPLRAAHLIAGGIITGQSGKRA